MAKFRAHIPFHGSNRACLGKFCNILRSTAPVLSFFLCCEASRSPLLFPFSQHPASTQWLVGGGDSTQEKGWEPHACLAMVAPALSRACPSVPIMGRAGRTQLGLGSEVV